MKPGVSSPLAGAGAGLAPTRAALDNGVVIIAKETRKTPAVSINLAMRAGSICDPPDAAGAMNLLARVSDRGTAAHSAAEIAEALDGRGISLNIAVSRHLSSFVCTCLAEDFEAVLTLVAEIVTLPSLPSTELAMRKREIVTALRQDEDSPYIQAMDGLLGLLYGRDHPYGRNVKGTIESVEQTTRDRLTGLHAGRFAPTELTVVIVGDVGTGRAVDAAAAALGGWRRPAPPAVPLTRPSPPSTRRQVVLPMMNKVQADLAYGFTAIARADPAYYSFQLMNNVLGEYALGGRLGDSIRERQGMAYYVSSSLDATVIEGPLVIRAGVGPANVDRAIASIDEELARLREEGISLKELNDSRQYVIGSMPRALETNAGIAGFLQTAEFYGLGVDHDVRLPDLLNAVTLDDVNAAARRIIDPTRATVVIAGPYQPK